jgi:hypothetical protein
MQALDLQQLGLLFYLLLGLIFLILIVLIVYVVIANRQQRARLARAHEEDRQSPRSFQHVTGQILSLVRDQSGEPLQVEIEGVKYRSLAEIKDPGARRKVMDAALELIRFTGVLGQDPLVPARREQTNHWREDVRKRSEEELKQIRAGSAEPAVQAQLPPVTKEAEEQFLSLLEESAPTRPAPDRPTLLGSIQGRMRAKPSEPVQLPSFVDDIEDILQRRIHMVPALIGRDLHVRLDQTDSVYFAFEGKEYPDLEDVPNLTARQLIKDAIEEWEETS